MKLDPFRTLGAASLLALGAALPAQAALVVDPGNLPPLGGLVVANNCGAVADPGSNTEMGCLQDARNTFVRLDGNERIEFSGGQATLEADSGNLGYLRVSFANGAAFSKLILNIDGDDDGKIRFFGVENGTTSYSSLFDLDDRGSNWFTLTGGPFTAAGFETFGWDSRKREYVARDIVDSVEQIRITEAQVPVPGTALLLGLGLAGLAGLRRVGAR